ncbi:MAG: DUF2334 domain-containing protein [Micrococcaceae bacterium]
MDSPSYRLSRKAKFGWIFAALLVPVLIVGAVFWVTDDSLVPFEGSTLTHEFIEDVPAGVAAEDDSPILDTRYGNEGGAETLVVYDEDAPDEVGADIHAILAANLATHFGMVQIRQLDDYEAGEINDYDAMIYVGASYSTETPTALLDDVRAGEVPVMWLGYNVSQLADRDAEAGIAFANQYGWDPMNRVAVDGTVVDELDYEDRTVTREIQTGGSVNVPRELSDEVEVLATGYCHHEDEAVVCAEGLDETSAPWIFRSDNLTVVTEIPFHYLNTNGLYTIYADLYYDLLDSDAEPVRQASVRFEDVGPEANPEHLRDIADYLSEEGVPFQVAVVPVMVDTTPDEDAYYGLSLLDSPDVVEALKYMQERGGTLIQHGTTHQYSSDRNPYSVRSGEDYEFYAHRCSATEEPPYEWEECQQDSWIRKLGPVAADSIEDHKARMERGKEIMIEAGLGEPTVFETPHYSGSINSYLAMAEEYDARYEQVEYYGGSISHGEITPEHSVSQVFPYSVKDIYGSTVYPENIENVTEVQQNNHDPRPPSSLLQRAENNLVVRESTASFYFHPFLNHDYLREMVDGLKEMDYEFVPVTELR